MFGMKSWRASRGSEVDDAHERDGLRSNLEAKEGCRINAKKHLADVTRKKLSCRYGDNRRIYQKALERERERESYMCFIIFSIS